MISKKPAKVISSDARVVNWIFDATKKYHGSISFVTMIVILNAGLALWNAKLLKDLIDAAVNKDNSALKTSGIILFLMTVAAIGCNLLARYLKERTAYKLAQHFQKRLFVTLLGKNYYSVSRKHSQEWMNRISEDSMTIADAIANIVPGVFGVVFHLIGTAYLLFITVPSLVGIIAIGAAFLIIINIALRNPLKNSQKAFRNAVGKRNIYLSEHLSKLMIVKAFNREEIAGDNSNEKFDDVTKKKTARLKILLMKDAIQNGSAKLASFLVVFYCATQILRGKISYGASVMLLRLLSQLRAPLTDVSAYISNIFDVFVAAERLMEAESYPDDPDVPVKSDDEIQEFYARKFKEIVFFDAGFSYLDELEKDPNIEPTIFSYVHITIPKASCIAFTGITGSGKSTIFKLLLSLYPLQEGTKTILCRDGSVVPLDASFRRLFAYVPQGNQLMSGTIRNMVTFGSCSKGNAGGTQISSSEREEPRIWQALEMACAKDFVEALPNGLDTEIGESGLGLSEGQLQRIAIARALYTKRPVILLDEATSALDEATEQRVLRNLKEMTDRTILAVTHRRATLSICDKEIHIDRNAVVSREVHH